MLVANCYRLLRFTYDKQAYYSCLTFNVTKASNLPYQSSSHEFCTSLLVTLPDWRITVDRVSIALTDSTNTTWLFLVLASVRPVCLLFEAYIFLL